HPQSSLPAVAGADARSVRTFLDASVRSAGFCPALVSLSPHTFQRHRRPGPRSGTGRNSKYSRRRRGRHKGNVTMSNGSDPFDFASLTVAHDEGNFAEAVVPPIFQTSLFTFSDYDDMIASYRGEKVRPIYTRGLNPTVRMFEEMLAKLEGAEDALGFAS